MNNKDEILKKLVKLRKEIEGLYENLDYSNDNKSYDDEKNIIELCNKAYPLIGYINWRFQEEFLLNLQEYEHRCYIEVDPIPYLRTCIGILGKVIEMLKSEKEYLNLFPTQKYYLKNRKLSILEDLDQIFRTSKNSILYYDLYMDEVIVSILEDIEIEEIKLLLSKPTNKFKTLVNAFKEQLNKDIECKIVAKKTIHDRYFIIDESDVWQTGGSINRNTMNSLTLSKIDDQDSKKKIIEDINEAWEDGNKIELK